jgi:signal transduction histidine kinase
VAAATRERIALWRLDSHLFPPLTVENNRPFTNYSALAVQAPVILDGTWNLVPDPGRVPSPLLSAPLPDWMLLHFQLDPTAGWRSPQVLSPNLEFHLQSEPLALPLDNCSPDRADRLADLRRRLPVERTLVALAELDAADPDTVPHVVPVPVADEPAADKPTVTSPATPPGQTVPVNDRPVELKHLDALLPESARWYETGFARGLSYRFNAPVVGRARPAEKQEQRRADAKDAETKGDESLEKKKAAEAQSVKANDPPAPAPTQQAQVVNPNPFNNGLQRQANDADLPPGARDRKGAADQVLSTRGGYDGPQFGSGGRGGQGPGGPGGNTAADNFKKMAAPGGGAGGALNGPGGTGGFGGGGPGGMPNGGGGGGGPGVGGPGAGGFGGMPQQPSGPGGLPSPQAKTSPDPAPTSAPVDPAKELEDKARNLTEWTGKQTRMIQDRNRSQQAEKSLRETDVPQKAKESNPSKPADLAKGGKADAKSTPLVPCLALAKPADEESGAAAEAKSPPVVTPAAVRLGPIRPRRLVADDGTEYLLLARAAVLDDRTLYQGVLVDWPVLQRTLTALVADLLPNAVLVPLRDGDDAPPERTMTTLPVRLDTGDDKPCPDCGWTPLRFGLVIAWAAALLAIVATAVGGRAVLAMSERRVRFASAVTHELRTPLTALQLHLDLLTSGLVTDEGKKAEYLATLSAEADRLNRLVENVLDFARLERQSARANARPVPVADLLDTLTHTWADRLRHEGFEFVTLATTPPSQAVTIDPRVLEQVLGNLIDNARKYAKGAADRRIWVRAVPADGGRVAFEVEDRGPGVPAGERRRIFQPFTRGSGAIDTGGAGLGLSLAKQWAELFGGSLTYHPAAGGVGACFRLELPAG